MMNQAMQRTQLLCYAMLCYAMLCSAPHPLARVVNLEDEPLELQQQEPAKKECLFCKAGMRTVGVGVCCTTAALYPMTAAD
jgi:hypothetical protein